MKKMACFWTDPEAAVPSWESLTPPDLRPSVSTGIAFASNDDPIGEFRVVLFTHDGRVVEMRNYATLRVVQLPAGLPNPSSDVSALLFRDFPTLNDHVIFFHSRGDGDLALVKYSDFEPICAFDDVAECRIDSPENVFQGPPSVEVRLCDGRKLGLDEVIRRVVSSSTARKKKGNSNSADDDAEDRRNAAAIRAVLKKNLVKQMTEMNEKVCLLKDSVRSVYEIVSSATVQNSSTREVCDLSDEDPRVRVVVGFSKTVEEKLVVGFDVVISVPAGSRVGNTELQLFPNVDLPHLDLQIFSLPRNVGYLDDEDLSKLGPLPGPGSFGAFLVAVTDIPKSFLGDLLDFSAVFRLEFEKRAGAAGSASGSFVLSQPWERRVKLRTADLHLGRCEARWEFPGYLSDADLVSIACSCVSEGETEQLCLNFRATEEHRVMQLLEDHLGFTWLPARKCFVRSRHQLPPPRPSAAAGGTGDPATSVEAEKARSLLGTAILGMTEQEMGLCHGGNTAWHCVFHSLDERQPLVFLNVLQDLSKTTAPSLRANLLIHCPRFAQECGGSGRRTTSSRPGVMSRECLRSREGGAPGSRMRESAFDRFMNVYDLAKRGVENMKI